MTIRSTGIAAAVTVAWVGLPRADAMNIALTYTGDLSTNTTTAVAARAAFQRAAQTWDSLFTDPITVNITAGLSSSFSSPLIIGATSTVNLNFTYTSVRAALIADAKDSHDAIAADLPAMFSANVPTDRTLSQNVTLTKADVKALGGGTGYDRIYGANDATITFNSNFAFTYDNSHGVAANTIDFQSVATHEIGHALGFDSVVDIVDENSAAVYPVVTPTALDLFRLPSAGTVNSSATTAYSAATFNSIARELRPGVEAEITDTSAAYRTSTGTNSANTDGNQASHWKDDALTGTYIGIMDPTISYATIDPVTNADVLAFDLIGYDVAVPEPTMLTALVTCALPLLSRRRRGSGSPHS